MTGSPAQSVAPKPICPNVLRAIFDWLGIAERAGKDLPSARSFPRNMIQYLDADGSRLALAHRYRGQGPPDPKWIRVDNEGWRNFLEQEGHRCNICILAKNRPKAERQD